MTPRRKILLLACVVLAGIALSERRNVPLAPRSAIAPALARPDPPVHAAAENRAEKKPEVPPRLTRREVVSYVRALYRREQLVRELALEQRRYAANYWDSPPGDFDPRELQRDREALLAQLAAEANQVLNEFFPGETGEPVVLEPFFATNRPGPNVSFLAPESLARCEAVLLAGVDGNDFVPERVLSAGEWEAYRKWNEPAADVLRTQLIGFNPTEAEFNSLLQNRRAIATDGEAHEAPTLEAALGAERYAALQRLQEPAFQTALADLRRLDLPLEQAEWLAATRTHAAAEIDAIWRSQVIGDLTKRELVGQLEHAYGETIAARLGLREASLDGLAPDS